jgi:3-deoxy-7-phosphoheptulonate synthase
MMKAESCSGHTPSGAAEMLAFKGEHTGYTRVSIGKHVVGGDKFIVIAGPCAIENEPQYLLSARHIFNNGGHVIRAGIYKPRTSPYSFQGLGEKAFSIIRSVKRQVDLPIIAEAMEINHLDAVAAIADIIQIGARNMGNSSLLKAVGRLRKPVLLKRGLSATVHEWLMAAEYILKEGNPDVILCERGIRTFETATRNTLDLSVVPLVKRISHLPIIVDPSHGTGKRFLVSPMAKAAVMAGADGLLIEVHPQPEKALSDGEQSINIDEFKQLMTELRGILPLVNKTLGPNVEWDYPGIGSGIYKENQL